MHHFVQKLDQKDDPVPVQLQKEEKVWEIKIPYLVFLKTDRSLRIS
jgi:protein involved in ribonucleotide reduction